MENIKIGKIVNAVALKGEVKVYHYTDYKERFEEINELIIDNKKYKIENVRYQKEIAIIKLEGINDRTMAENIKDKDIYITENDLRELPEDTYYIKDLVGLKVVDYQSGDTIGTVSDVLQNSAQDIYTVKLENGKEIMIPAVSEFIKEISMDEKNIKVKLIPGFMDL
ncbi:MAG: ribosome maturation factor RimM [Eubacteriales bacterium]|nr:ribosome maturation factor RimM [Eubacteriales bacterium]